MNENLSLSVGSVSCSGCGTTSRTDEGWLIRPTEDGQIALCPSCTAQAEQELEQQGQDINMPRAVLFGAVAALVGGAIWYGLVIATDYKLGIIAIGVGWLVGKGVVLGAANKRSVSLQVAGGLLALAALFVGEYLIINYMLRQAIEEFAGWLTLAQFIQIYPQLLAEGNSFLDIVFFLIAIYEGAVLPRPIKLKA